MTIHPQGIYKRCYHRYDDKFVEQLIVKVGQIKIEPNFSFDVYIVGTSYKWVYMYRNEHFIVRI